MILYQRKIGSIWTRYRWLCLFESSIWIWTEFGKRASVPIHPDKNLMESADSCGLPPIDSAASARRPPGYYGGEKGSRTEPPYPEASRDGQPTPGKSRSHEYLRLAIDRLSGHLCRMISVSAEIWDFTLITYEKGKKGAPMPSDMNEGIIHMNEEHRKWMWKRIRSGTSCRFICE